MDKTSKIFLTVILALFLSASCNLYLLNKIKAKDRENNASMNEISKFESSLREKDKQLNIQRKYADSTISSEKTKYERLKKETDQVKISSVSTISKIKAAKVKKDTASVLNNCADLVIQTEKLLSIVTLKDSTIDNLMVNYQKEQSISDEKIKLREKLASELRETLASKMEDNNKLLVNNRKLQEKVKRKNRTILSLLVVSIAEGVVIGLSR